MTPLRAFLSRVRKNGVKRNEEVSTTSMGKARVFRAWDLGEDTFIFEKGIGEHLSGRPSVLIVEKSELGRRAKGRVLTISSGNHSVAAFPLLDGRFWKLARLPAEKRGDVLMHSILCANVVGGNTIEISQRDVPPKKLFAADEWLLGTVGFSMNDVVMGDRTDAALEHYRRLGAEWRVKPLAWTSQEMKVALAAAKKRISSKLNYYHSARGVHFLTLSEFKRFAALAGSDPQEFIKGMRELVSVYEGNTVSFLRMPKFRGHHEIEFFGIRRGQALDSLVPELERLMEAIVLGRVKSEDLVTKMNAITELFASLVSKPELGDETSDAFVETLYMYITGEIYSVVGEGSTPAFDDRRTALPGATFVDGRPVFHPLADDRSEVLLSNLRALMSKDEHIEYANVYELRTEDESVKIGKGRTREIVYKTNRNPIEASLVEKRFSTARKGYSSYMLARVDALKALGVALSEYRVLRRRASTAKGTMDYFVRSRLEGEPLDSVPNNYFCNIEDSSVEESETVKSVATLMGDAAAQNMAMKKFDPASESPLYGVGKEIYDFEYDVLGSRVVAKKVSTCSVRGSFGWPSLDRTDENLQHIAQFYMLHFAHTIKKFQREHSVPMGELAQCFWNGFEYRTHAMAWQLSVLRDQFEAFHPELPRTYRFDDKWRFLMWSLERQERRLSTLKRIFMEKVEVMQNENLRSDSEPLRLE